MSWRSRSRSCFDLFLEKRGVWCLFVGDDILSVYSLFVLLVVEDVTTAFLCCFGTAETAKITPFSLTLVLDNALVIYIKNTASYKISFVTIYVSTPPESKLEIEYTQPPLYSFIGVL